MKRPREQADTAIQTVATYKKQQPSQFLNPLRIFWIGSFLSLFIWVMLEYWSRTPRARLNVFQGTAVIFFAVVAVRAMAGVRSDKSRYLPESRWNFWPAVCLSAAAWVGMIFCYFTSDDFSLLYQMQHLTRDTIWTFLMKSQAGVFFRPLGWASLLFEYRLWHMWPAGYHLTALLIHLTSVAGVYWMGKNLRLRQAAAAASALVFGIFPIEIEAIAWAICRFDLLATCLTVWAVAFYARYRQPGRPIHYWVAMALFVLAMLSKESGYVLPLFLLAAELFVFPEPKFLPWLGTLATGLGMFAVRWILIGGIGGYAGTIGKKGVSLLNVKLLEGLILRAPSQTIFGINWLQPCSAWFLAACSVLSAALLITAYCARPTSSDRAALRFGLCWMFASLLPAHALLLIGAGLTNARVLYMCSVGAAITIGSLLSAIKIVNLRRAMTGLIAVMFCSVILHNGSAWYWTTERTRIFPVRLKELVPAPPSHAEFVFRNMPDTIRGVFFYREGLQEAVRMAYQRDDLYARRENAEAQQPRGPILRFDWDETSSRVGRSIPLPVGK
jgi:hypothetical protein